MTLPSSGPLALTDIQTEFGGANPIGMNEYYAGGGLVPAGTSGTYGAVPSSGTISVQNFYGTSNFVPVYIEDVFSTWLYTGTGATQTITNGINLSANGGLTWCKGRSNPYDHYLFDTARGANNYLISNYTGAQNAFGTYSNLLTSFNTNGFSLGADSLGSINVNNVTYASWTFRKQPKFFDIVTYTGNGNSGPQTISHNLGSVPGAIICKSTSSTYDWGVYHRSLGATKGLYLNLTQAEQVNNTLWNDTAPTSTTFTVGASGGSSSSTNANGVTYVAYLFAHNAGGFGATGTDNVISCGSITMPSGYADVTVNLGYEPQFIMMKSASYNDSIGWFMCDNMRGMDVTNPTNILLANTSGAEQPNSYNLLKPTSTGFTTGPQGGGWFNQTYIYIAIRRGPMKVPTVGTSVFTPYSTGNDSVATDMNFPIDAFWENNLGGSAYNTSTASRLTGNASMLWTSSNSSANGFFSSLFSNTRQNYYTAGLYGGGTSVIQYGFQRAPGFMDVVCYTGTGSATTVTHNLGAVPQWIIVKRRSGTESGGGIFVPGDWFVYSSALGNDYFVTLNGADSKTNSGVWNYTSPTSSVFSVGTFFTNYSGDKYIAYLFATVAGVSKVGSYTGTGAARTIDCGFTTGARFVLIRQTANGGGSWYLWDSARGISSSNDPYILLDSTGAQVSGTNYVDTASVGFQITSAATAADINTLYAPYIFLAIA